MFDRTEPSSPIFVLNRDSIIEQAFLIRHQNGNLGNHSMMKIKLCYRFGGRERNGKDARTVVHILILNHDNRPASTSLFARLSNPFLARFRSGTIKLLFPK